MRSVLVGVATVVLVLLAVSAIRVGTAFWIFEAQQAVIDPALKAERLAELLAAPLPVAVALGLLSFPAGLAFGRFSKAGTLGKRLFRTLFAAIAALCFTSLTWAMVSAVTVYFLAMVGVHFGGRPLIPARSAPAGPDFEARLEEIRNRQLARRAERERSPES